MVQICLKIHYLINYGITKNHYHLLKPEVDSMTNTMTEEEIERVVDELINQKENNQFHDYGLRRMANEYGEANHIALGLPGQYTKLTTTELFINNNNKKIYILI